MVSRFRSRRPSKAIRVARYATERYAIRDTRRAPGGQWLPGARRVSRIAYRSVAYRATRIALLGRRDRNRDTIEQDRVPAVVLVRRVLGRVGDLLVHQEVGAHA